ncbi:MAG: type III-B CRISPR module-associated protein Cmr3 [Synergistales bacterium]|nr:type III-B CRISPR module-associated protein Cmr3 [Synergistales bacterium]
MSGQEATLRISPRDPLIFRDGRPFNAGEATRARTRTWPPPSQTTGAVRSLLGKLAGVDFRESAVIERLLALEVSGPLPFRRGKLFFPAPLDFTATGDAGADGAPTAHYPLRPEKPADGGGTDLPGELEPLLLPEEAGDFKPGTPPPFWSRKRIASWLAGSGDFRADYPADGEDDHPEWITTLPTDERTHVCIDPARGSADEGLLFSTSACDFALRDGADETALSILLRVRPGGGPFGDALAAKPDRLATLGGERRTVRVASSDAAPWDCPGEIRAALRGAEQVRMVLATDALFTGGWKPGWLDSQLRGVVPGTGVRVRLRAAAVGRGRYHSGWSYDRSGGRRPGPKPARRAVPAGSVYFFDVEQGSAEELAPRWLEPVSDEPQDALDGFGLALWGIW